LAEELRSGPLDLATFYLDDGVIAGDIDAVSAALSHTQAQCAELGLRLNLDKCEIIKVGLTTDGPLATKFPDTLLRTSSGESKVQTHFELLGAAIGDAAFIAAHTTARVAKASALLDAIASLEDPQVGLRLLRSCAGHTRMVHSLRCNPPEPQLAALQAFDHKVRSSFSMLTGIHLSKPQWEQAGRAFGHWLGTSVHHPRRPSMLLGICRLHVGEVLPT
jgi:hypothetical protein